MGPVEDEGVALFEDFRLQGTRLNGVELDTDASVPVRVRHSQDLQRELLEKILDILADQTIDLPMIRSEWEQKAEV